MRDSGHGKWKSWPGTIEAIEEEGPQEPCMVGFGILSKCSLSDLICFYSTRVIWLWQCECNINDTNVKLTFMLREHFSLPLFLKWQVVFFVPVFPLEDFYISPFYDLELSFQLGVSFPFSFSFCFSSFSAICKASLDNCIASCISFSLRVVTASCTMLEISVHSSSLCLSDLIPWIFLTSLLYNHKRFDLGHIRMS